MTSRLSTESIAAYATSVANLKGVPQSEADVRAALSTSLGRVYRAVALDVDGTLTPPGQAEVDPGMGQIVDRLLARGVPVLLISGRGGSVIEAARQIREGSALSNWYFRRLYCIGHNGVVLHETPRDEPDRFLEVRTTLLASVPEGLDDLFEAAKALVEGRDFELSPRREPLPSRAVHVAVGEHSARFVFHSEPEREELWEPLKLLAERFSEEQNPVFLSKGIYATSHCLDLTPTNKEIALDRFAVRIGIPTDRILRIGDQGQEGGNDFDLLNSSSGFSVGDISSEPTACFPVLDDRAQPLHGAAATRRLLESVLLFAPLSITAASPEQCREYLSGFHRRAVQRARVEAGKAAERVRVRLGDMIESDRDGGLDVQSVLVSDLFDPFSGAVRFHDWELDQLTQRHPATELFGLTDLPVDSPPRLPWAMYSDTGMLLRGPNYYFGLTHEQDDTSLPAYLRVSERFLESAREAILQLGEQVADLASYKLALAILDNVRNMLIQLAYAAFTLEGGQPEGRFEATRRLYRSGVVQHTSAHMRFLLSGDQEWAPALSAYGRLIEDLLAVIRESKTGLLAILGEHEAIGRDLFKFRECDDFVQNVTAVQLGVTELRRSAELSAADSLAAVGLAYGGLELPAIAAAVGQARGYSVTPVIAKVSIYGDTEIGARVRSGDRDHVDRVLRESRNVCAIDDPDWLEHPGPSIIMDDNCTTAVTLQLARDLLVAHGVDVVGSVVIRFPGSNRYAHMAKEGHGLPDPDVLFTFIRGLVAPSPYTRLLAPDPNDPRGYRDSTGVFNKAKDRVTRYLTKNDTPPYR